MAEIKIPAKCGFFDAINKDRTYSAEQMNKPYKRVITNGVFATPQGTSSTDLQVVSANDGMKIIVKKGDGLFADKWFENPSNQTITVTANNSIAPRRDSIIVQVDTRNIGRVGNIVYREGIPSSDPQVPDINTVDGVIEYRIANIYVAAGASNINNDAIVDLRGSSECPWVTSLIQQVDTSTLFLQWQTAYELYFHNSTQDMDAYMAEKKQAWDDFMKHLTEELEVATNIITLEKNYTTLTDTTYVPINIPAYNKDTDVLQVYVNKLRATPEVDYEISDDGLSIELNTTLLANQSVNFLVLKSVVPSDVQSMISLVQELNDRISTLHTDTGWIDFWLEGGAVAYDATTKPAIRKHGDKVYIRGAIKGFNTLNVPICTLPLVMRPAMNIDYPMIAYNTDGSIAGQVVLEVRTTGSIYLVAKSGNIPTTCKLPIDTQFLV